MVRYVPCTDVETAGYTCRTEAYGLCRSLIRAYQYASVVKDL